jgi:hypothetical protein
MAVKSGKNLRLLLSISHLPYDIHANLGVHQTSPKNHTTGEYFSRDKVPGANISEGNSKGNLPH